MSGGVKGCGVCFFEGEGDADHVRHAHAAILMLLKKLRGAHEKIDRLEKLFSVQKKNKLLLELSRKNAALKEELARIRVELISLKNGGVMTASELLARDDLARAAGRIIVEATPSGEIGAEPLPEDQAALMQALGEGP